MSSGVELELISITLRDDFNWGEPFRIILPPCQADAIAQALRRMDLVASVGHSSPEGS